LNIILFDLDGTIIDSTEPIIEAFNYSFDYHNHPRPKPEDIVKLIGYTLEDIFGNLGAYDVPSFVSVYKSLYREIGVKKTKLIPLAKDAIIKASKFAKLGVVTTKTARYSKDILDVLDILQYFDVVVGREDVINAKPSAEPIHKALSNFDSYSRVTMIGDTPMDLMAAKNSNIDGLAVLTGYADINLLKEHTDNIFNNLFEAIEWLEKKY